MTKPEANRFNLVREKWVPIAEGERASLVDLFSDPSLPALAGNAIEKISLLKLALAIAQAACTPEDEAAWKSMGPRGMADSSASYLCKHEEQFWLYGEHPFLQMHGIACAEKVPFGALQPMIATGNTTVLVQSQIERPYSEAETAVLLVTIMNFAQGGKKADNTVVLSTGYQGKSNNKGKPSTAKAGPALGFIGYLHSFLEGESIQETTWLNLLTKKDIGEMSYLSEGLGVPVWEAMPAGEDDTIARRLRESYLGRLVPLSRFVLLKSDGIHYSEGILYPGYKEGAQDASIAVMSNGERKALWANPDMRPWRQLPALLSFFDATSGDQFDCRLLRAAIPRVSRVRPTFALWSGGLKVSSNAGEQYVSGLDDFVESEISLTSSWLGFSWFQKLKLEMEKLKALSTALCGSINGYSKALKADGTEIAKKFSDSFWNDCEDIFQDLVDACGATQGEELSIVRKRFARYAEKAYDNACPRETARQIEAWAAHRLSTYRYLDDSPVSANQAVKALPFKKRKTSKSK
jgi:CRISPR system Cascade subunit CasA